MEKKLNLLSSLSLELFPVLAALWVVVITVYLKYYLNLLGYIITQIIVDIHGEPGGPPPSQLFIKAHPPAGSCCQKMCLLKSPASLKVLIALVAVLAPKMPCPEKLHVFKRVLAVSAS